MPRTARAWEPGAILHVVARAHSGAPIFAMDEDREFVVQRAARVFREEGVECFAWAVLVNHYHMLARFPEPPRRPMSRLNTAIAMRVRRLQGGEGPVFQDRSWGRPCADGAAVLTRLAYVTANPIHHRVVPSVPMLEDYAWSSLGELTGRRPARLANPVTALALLDAPRGAGVASLRCLLELRVRLWDDDDAARPEPRSPDDDAPLDDDDENEDDVDGGAVSPVTPSTASWDEISSRRQKLRAAGWTPDALLGAACAVAGVEPAAVRSGSRRHAVGRARAIVAHLACNHLAWPTSEVARCLAISASSTVEARARAPALIAAAGLTDRELLRRAGVPA